MVGTPIILASRDLVTNTVSFEVNGSHDIRWGKLIAHLWTILTDSQTWDVAMASPLQVDVFVAPAIPAVLGLSDPKKSVWSPISITVIHNAASAVIVDTPITVEETEKFIDWFEKTLPGKTVEYIFITHAHGVSYFLLLTSYGHNFEPRFKPDHRN